MTEKPSSKPKVESKWNRRDFLRSVLLTLPAPLLLASGDSSTLNDTQPVEVAELPPTPTCADDDELTPPQVEGPFFTPSSPQRTSLLEPTLPKSKLTLTGYVLSTTCEPLSGVLLDFWQADHNGIYDTVGYRLRGHQYTDAAGRFYLETIRPGLYPGRTRHIHVKVQAANQPVLTTQLYFPLEAHNEADIFYDPALLLKLYSLKLGEVARFDFVLNRS